MGGVEKPLLALGDGTLLDHVVARAGPQTSRLALNVNGSSSAYARFRLPILADIPPGGQGPLAGIATGLAWAAAEADGAGWLALFAGDTPFFPVDLTARLLEQAGFTGAAIIVPSSKGRIHPTFGLWRTNLAREVSATLAGGGSHAVRAFMAGRNVAKVPIEGATVDPFFNVNTPDDLLEARRMLAEGEA